MSVDERRLFALIPAAGRSRRMGQPKLLLPFSDTTVIGRLIRVLRAARLAEVLVLVRPVDAALADEVRAHGAAVVQPTSAPPEMRVSVEHLLHTIEERYFPAEHDGWLLIPGDHPLVNVETLRLLIAAWRQQPKSIILPTKGGRRGHPTIFPWAFADKVHQLPTEVGVNHLMRQENAAIVEVSVDDPTILLDLDTPGDYENALSFLSR